MVRTLRKEPPPPKPAIFYGREGLVDRISSILLRPERCHVALLGTGGIGKSSLAKAILHDSGIMGKFGNHRSFIPFDDLRPSQITFHIFIDRVCKNLGISSSGTPGPILGYLERQNTFLVIDNAETFLDPEVLDASRIKDAIDAFGALLSVSILITSRSRELPCALCCKEINVPNLDAEPSYEVFTRIYGQDAASSRPALHNILLTVGYHCLSITLLACAAKVNGWSIDELSQQWKDRHTELLNPGHGKNENLAESIKLSLDTPSIQVYGEDVRRILGIIAFLPQGVSQVEFQTFFPTISQVQRIIDILRRQSIIILDGGFITMLVPIRLYINDAIPTPDAALLDTARNHYYSVFDQESDFNENTIKTEDINLESLLASDLQALSGQALERTIGVCASFIHALHFFKPRPTYLVPIIHAIDTSHSQTMTLAKLDCLSSISAMVHRQGSFTEALELEQKQYDLAQKAGSEKHIRDAIVQMAVTCIWLGQYRIARQHLERILVAKPEAEVNPDEEWSVGLARFCQAIIKEFIDAQISGASLAALFPDGDVGRIHAALAPALIDGETQSSRVALESIISDSRGSQRSDEFLALAAVAALEGAVEETKQLLNLSRANYLRQGWSVTLGTMDLLRLTIFTIGQGTKTEGRDLITQANEELQTSLFVSHECRWLSLYASGALELVCDQLAKAYQLFEDVKQYCEEQEEFRVRAFSTRAMGEIAYLQKDVPRAREHFEETVQICEDAGIPTSLLYNRHFGYTFIQFAPPATYDGWPLFLKGHLPLS